MKQTNFLLVIINVVSVISLVTLALIYITQPVNALTVNLVVKKMAGALFIFFLFGAVIINFAITLWDRYRN
ncbi:hypothetical protein [Robertmurraya massiliosenegalensis]|uniref:hypothetical protein n=1 Tax=Robertmurraya massiliosenegalensis TaxID=1287657 RepID=UPI00037A4032|nr:hypothetical protein [Robertmurraya massiliosenegalensis]